MKNFRRLCLAIALLAVFTMPAKANPGETASPPLPGETQSPPAPGDGHGPGAAVTDEGQGATLTFTGDVHSPAWTVVLFAFEHLVF